MSFSLQVLNSNLCGGSDQDNIKQLATPTYVVVKEGGCSFPRKAIEAEKIGAQGVIFGSK